MYSSQWLWVSAQILLWQNWLAAPALITDSDRLRRNKGRANITAIKGNR
jgi:hypothetical protein